MRPEQTSSRYASGGKTGSCLTMKKFMLTPLTENRAAQSRGMEFMLVTTRAAATAGAVSYSTTGALLPTPLDGSPVVIKVRSFVAVVIPRRA